LALSQQREDMTKRVGITGHQRLNDPSAWSWVKSAITNELDALEPPLIGISSLAIGADQVFATMMVQRGGQLHVVIPFEGYERTFSSQDLDAYHRTLSKASVIEIMQTNGTEEDRFLAAGMRIVDLADLIVAVWDGKPAMGKGGTADIVAYAIQINTKIIHINPVDHTVTEK